MKRSLLLVGVVLLLGATAARAQSVTVEELSCVPVGDNIVVHGTASGEPAGGSVRLYFRWEGHGEFFWSEMEPAAAGSYWGVLPKPERRTDQVEYYAAVFDAAGQEVKRSSTRVVNVKSDCKVKLAPREEGVAENLTVGETAAQQQGKSVLGFLCDGIVTRVNWQGIRRADDVCRACVVAWWQRKAVLIPPAGLVGILVVDGEPSPSRP
jgi:hypothetical protein